MNLLKNLRMSLSNFDFVIIYIIYKILVFLKNHLSYFKDSIFKRFFKEYNTLLSFLKKSFFFLQYKMMENPKDMRNLFRLKKKQNYTAIKDIRTLFRPEKN